MRFAVLALLGLVTVNAISINQMTTNSLQRGQRGTQEEGSGDTTTQQRGQRGTQGEGSDDTTQQRGQRGTQGEGSDDTTTQQRGQRGEGQGEGSDDTTTQQRGQRGEGEGEQEDSEGRHEGPTADELISLCDADGNGALSLEEAHQCINDNVPEEHQADAHAQVDEHFDEVDADADGEVDAAELEAALDAREEDRAGRDERRGRDEPTAEEIFATCDADGDGFLSQTEAVNCINEHVPEEHRQEAIDSVEEHWNTVDAD